MALVRSFLVVGANVLGSRVLGFVRDVLIASSLGAGGLADAWVVAFRIPNLFRRIFAEGAFNSAFIPLFAGRLEMEGEASAKRFAEESFSALLAALVVVTLVAEIAMPWLMHVIAPGFAAEPAKFRHAVLFTRIALPYLVFISLIALMSGMLNSLHRFALAAAVPMLLNVVLIGALLFLTPLVPSAGHALVAGVALAGLVQFLVTVYGVSRIGMMPRLVRPRLTPGVRRLIQLGVPGVVAGGITQVNILIGTMISTYEPGAASVLYYADRIYQLPLGVVGVAIGIVLLPELARRLRSGDSAGAQDGQNRALEFALLLTLPAAVALIVIPGPITNVLFERGAFTPEDATRTARALMAFGFGLPAFVLVKVFSPGYFAQEDTVTPLRYAGTSIAHQHCAEPPFLFPSWVSALSALRSRPRSQARSTRRFWASRSAGASLLRFDRRLVTRLPRIVLASARHGARSSGCIHALAPWRAVRPPRARACGPGGSRVCRLRSFLRAHRRRRVARLAPRVRGEAPNLIPLRDGAFTRDKAPRFPRPFGVTFHGCPRRRTASDRQNDGSHKLLVFSGVQPTGSLHLGNYLGAIKNWVPLQARHDCIFCVVDMHAITIFQEPAELKRATRRVAAAYIASGIDPAEDHHLQSDPGSRPMRELAWIFNCVTRMGWLGRMTQFKEKAGKHRENASAGLFVYPNLMAADVLLYKATHVPVGEDQKQHLELMRDIAQKFNNDFGVPGFFPLPEPLDHGTRDARHVLARRAGENVEIRSVGFLAHQSHRRARQDRGEDQRRRAPIRIPCPTASKASKAVRKRTISSRSMPRLRAKTRRR